MSAVLLYSIAGGMLCVLGTGNPRQVSWRFVRVVAMIVLAIASLPTLWRIRESGWAAITLTSASTLGIVAAVCAAGMVMLGPMTSRRSFAFRSLSLLGGCAGLIAACRLALSAMPVWSSASRNLSIINQLSAAVFLGSITVAWLLGHAYLTATKMTIAPLRHFSRVFTWCVWLRTAFVAASFAISLWVFRESLSAHLAELRGAWLYLLLRVGVGLIGVGVFAYMVNDCVRLRSTQSATGILYFGSLLAYVGELAGLHLSREIGWPL